MASNRPDIVPPVPPHTEPVRQRKMPRVRVTMTSSIPSKLMAEANSHLTSPRPKTALEIYTNILESEAPGHPAAFLNRSLCYLLLNYPSLAATDAYRAILAAEWAKTGDKDNQLAKHLLNYHNATQHAAHNGHEWAVEPTCYAGAGEFVGLNNHLSSLVITPTVRTAPGECDTLGLVDLVNDIILKAYYRLALALWKCGGGAMKDALHTLNKVRDLPFCVATSDSEASDKAQFDDLENHILRYISQVMEVEEEYCKDEAILETKGIRGLLKTRYTRVRRELYPWDNISLNQENLNQLSHKLQTIASKINPNCALGTLKRTGKTPKLGLYTTGDITCPQLFVEGPKFFASSHSDLVCESCGSLLDITTTAYYIAKQRAEILAKQEEEASTRFNKRGTQTQDGHQSKAANAPQHDTNDIPFASSPEATYDREDPSTYVGDQFQMCPGICGAVFCSYACHERVVKHYHTFICSMGLDEVISEWGNNYKWDGVPTKEHESLLGKLLLRVLAFLRVSEGPPLELDWLQILDGDLDYSEGNILYDKEGCEVYCGEFAGEFTNSIDEIFPSYNFTQPVLRNRGSSPGRETTIPWSLDANVRRPIHFMYSMGGSHLALDVKRFDGWVFNTIIAKIEAAMRVTTHPRFGIAYDNECEVIHKYCLPAQDPSLKYNPGQPDQEFNEQIWVASLHPVSTLIHDVNLSKTFRANVCIVERQGSLYCKSIPRPMQENNPFDNDGMNKSSSQQQQQHHHHPWILSGEHLVHEPVINNLHCEDDFKFTPAEFLERETRRETQTSTQLDVNIVRNALSTSFETDWAGETEVDEYMYAEACRIDQNKKDYDNDTSDDEEMKED